MPGMRDSDELNFSLSDLPLTPRQESNLVRIAEAFSSMPTPRRPVPPELQSVLPRFAAAMQRVWQDREMPPAVAAFASRFGS
jgi:hypothetical protein